MLERSYAAIIAKTIQPQEEGLVFFNQPISSIYTKMPVFFATELVVLALKGESKRSQWKKHLIDPRAVLKPLGW